MKSLRQYHIPFTGLKLGKHQFEFDVDNSFFEEFEYSLVKNGTLKVNLELDKQETMFVLNFHITGEIYVTCDVCLSEFPTRVDRMERQLVKFTNEDLEDDTEEIIILSKNDYELDVSGLIYEYITLSVPYINRCEDGGEGVACDKEMIETLAKLSSGNQEITQDADPRWDALNKIKNKK